TADRPGVAVVSESFVQRYWPGQDPLGHQFDILTFQGRLVVGVVGDVRFRGLERVNEPQVYMSSKQVPNAFYAPRSLAVRTSVVAAQAVRDIVGKADPTVAITQMQMAGALIEAETAPRSVQVRVLGAFAAIAFVLAAVGIHGLLSFAVSQRTHEIGVRMALGADVRDVLGLITRRSLALAAIGIAPGSAIAYAAGRWMEALLAGVKPFDPSVFAVAAALAALMTIAGSVVPAIRAARVDPISALRAE